MNVECLAVVKDLVQAAVFLLTFASFLQHFHGVGTCFPLLHGGWTIVVLGSATVQRYLW